MQRQIQFPGLQRTANGSTGANQFLGQVETGYRIGLFAPAAASVTPFARLQGSTVTQNAFSEWGANSLSLNVAQQTTNSLRTVFGADLAGAIAARQRAQPGARPAPGLAARVCRHRPADHGGLRRRAVQRLHRLWRDAAARRGGDRLLGRHSHRRGDASSTCATTARSARDRQPHAQSRRAHLLVALSIVLPSEAGLGVLAVLRAKSVLVAPSVRRRNGHGHLVLLLESRTAVVTMIRPNPDNLAQEMIDQQVSAFYGVQNSN